MRMKVIYSLLISCVAISVTAQNPNGNYNPYVNSGNIEPSPLWPTEANGAGVVRFNIGNSGSDPLEVFDDQHITLTLTLSYGAPMNGIPADAVGGSAAGLFSWKFNGDTYSARQVDAIPAGYSGTIEIAYRVTGNSSSPGLNGFNVNISPAPYQTESNAQDDDAVSSYTYTEIRDYGDAPATYGTAWHIIDFNNYLGSLVDGEVNDQPSASADADDLDSEADDDGVVFPAEIPQGENVNLSITVTGLGYLSAWIDWNIDGDFEDEGERVAENVIRSTGTSDLQISVPMDAAINVATFTRFRFSKEPISESGGDGDKGEVEDYMITVTASPSAPTAPGDLAATQSTQNAVSLSWSAATDDVGVEGYTIYRNDNELATTADLNYTDNTVAYGITYSYAVSAYDADGYVSERTAAIEVEILDITDPSVPAGLTITSQTSNSLSLSWSSSTDNVGVTGYNIYRDGAFLAGVSGLTFTDDDVTAGNTYAYEVSALDAAGNESSPSGEVTAEIAEAGDTEAPTIPAGLTLQVLATEVVQLTWNASNDNTGVTGYNVYRNEALLGTTALTSYTDSTIVQGNTYEYTITAFDAAGNESAPASPVSVGGTDVVPPSVPAGLMVLSVAEAGISIAWHNATDNVEVTGYNIFRDGDMHGTAEDTSMLDVDVVPGLTYVYRVSAFDAAGNESGQSDPLTITMASTNYMMASQLRVHPNPSNGEFILELEGATGDFLLEIISPLGELVEQRNVQMGDQGPEMLINLPDYPPGLYNIRVYRDDAVYFGKLMLID